VGPLFDPKQHPTEKEEKHVAAETTMAAAVAAAEAAVSAAEATANMVTMAEGERESCREDKDRKLLS